MSNPPKFFRASTPPEPPKFSDDSKIKSDWTDDQICPTCKKSFAVHSPGQIIDCALIQLRGEKKS